MAEGGVDVSPPVSEYLPVDLDYITADLKEQARSELFEDEDTKVRSLKALRNMLRKEKDFCWQDDNLFLLAFLRARKYDVKKAFTIVKALYNSFGKHGRVFYNMDLDYLKRIMEENCLYFLPYRDRDGSVVVCYRYSAWDPDKFTAEEILVCLVLGLLQALTSPSTQIAGFRFIVDTGGLDIKRVVHSRLSDLLFISDIFQSSVPIRVKGIHIVNQSSFFYYLWNVIKQFLSRKIQERMNLHGNDMKSLHEFIHPSILPVDYGGELPQFDNSDWRRRMEASDDYIRRLLSFGYEKYLKKDWRTGNQ